MTVHRFAISFDQELARLVRKSAAREPISTWLADAAQRKLRSEGLLEVVRGWEAEHGEITPEQMRSVERELLRPRRVRKRRRR